MDPEKKDGEKEAEKKDGEKMDVEKKDGEKEVEKKDVEKMDVEKKAGEKEVEKKDGEKMDVEKKNGEKDGEKKNVEKMIVDKEGEKNGEVKDGKKEEKEDSKTEALGTQDPFTKLHMIQADYGDTLLMEFRAKAKEEPTFWMTDGGPSGQRYQANEMIAPEHMFSTLNTIVPTGLAKSAAGVPFLDRLIVTHPHDDHTAGIELLLASLAQAGDLKSGMEPAKIPTRLEQYSWQKGLERLKTDKKLPIKRLWYNDQTAIRRNLPGEEFKQLKDDSWMRPLLRNIATTWTEATTEDGKAISSLMNAEFAKAMGDDANFQNVAFPVVTREVASIKTLDSCKVLLPSQNQLKVYAYTADDGQHPTPGAAYDTLHSGTKGPLGKGRLVDEKWTKANKLVNAPSFEKSPDNCISIVCEFTNNASHILMTGDHSASRIQTTLRQDFGGPLLNKYDIIKMPHHGSCYNCLAQAPPGDEFAKFSKGTNCLRNCYLFFRFFKAKYYCFSSNPFGDHPNPDIYTISALVDGYIDWGTETCPAEYKTVHIVTTNGMPYNGFSILRERGKLATDFTFRVWYMKIGESYCTIDASSGPVEDHLVEIKGDEEFYKYYIGNLSKDDNATWEAAGKGGTVEIKDRLANLYSSDNLKYDDIDKQKLVKTRDVAEGKSLQSIEDELDRLQRVAEKEEAERNKKRGRDKEKPTDPKDKPPRRDRKNSRRGGDSELVDHGSKAFCFAGIMRGEHGEKLLEESLVHADQGSDFNIITEDLATACGLSIQPLTFYNPTLTAVQVRMADGRERNLRYATSFDFGLSGIWRKIGCLVLEKTPHKRERLLLGLPWLYDVNAQLNIRESIMKIGDISKGENEQWVQGPKVDCVANGGLRFPHSFSSPQNASTTLLTGDVFAVGTADPMPNGTSSNQGLPVEPPLKEVYHDLTTSKFRLSDVPAWTYFLDFPAPKSDPSLTTSTSDGRTGWVDLGQFISLLKRDNSFTATDDRPKLSDRFFQRLATWLPAAGAYPGGADATLSILLTAFFDNDTATEIIGALPLNPNGPLSSFESVQQMSTSAAVAKMPVFNLRFEVETPSLITASRLETLSMYFELHMGTDPPSYISNSLEPADIMTWQVPFSNTSFSRGQMTMSHDPVTGVRVKIVWPFYQNRVMIAHFDSNLKVTRRFKTFAPLKCKGTVYKKAQGCATYDIRFGDLDILDIFAILSPASTSFSTSFGSSFSLFNIQPLIDIVDSAVHIKAKDVGIIFRQNYSYVNAVTLDDVYGSLDFSDSPLNLDLPGVEWNLPLKDLPALTITLGKMASQKDQTVNLALTKSLSDLGFIGLRGTFSRSKMRVEFDATLLCENKVSLGVLVEKGLGILHPDCLDSDFMSTMHAGSLSAKTVTDGVKDILDDVFVPAARVQVARSPSGSFKVTEIEVHLELADIAFPSSRPVVVLRDFDVRVLQQRIGLGPQSTGSSTSTSVYGSASIDFGNVDAHCKFIYDPSGRPPTPGLRTYPVGSTSGRQIILEVDFPTVKPSIGDIVDQVVGELSNATHNGTFQSKIPSALSALLDVAQLEVVQITLNSEKEGSPWNLVGIYVRVDLANLATDINKLLDDAFQLERPILTVTVSDPCTPQRGFDIQLSSVVEISGIVCTLLVDVQKGLYGPDSTDTIAFSFQWDPISEPMTLRHVVNHLAGAIDDGEHGSAQNGDYLAAISKVVPEAVTSLIDDINIETVQIMAANFSKDPTATKYSLGSVYVQVTDTGEPWAPFGSDWAHLTFAGTSMGYSFFSGGAINDGNAKGATTFNFVTRMCLASLKLNIQFNYTSNATEKGFTLALTNIGQQHFSLIDLVSEMLNDVHRLGIGSITLPEDAKQLFDIDIASLSISYLKTTAPTETISFQQTGLSTFLGVSVASISVDCNRASSGWGYGVQVQLPKVTKPFAKVLPIPGIESFTVLNGAFGVFKGPANPPSQVAPMVGPSDNGTSIYLSGSIKLEGNDFLNLVGTIIKIPQIDFAVRSGGDLTVRIPVGKLEISVKGYPMFAVSEFFLNISMGNFTLSGELDLLCEWLAPSIKEKPIGFRIMVGIANDGSLIVSIYSVDPKTGVVYPDMSKDLFIYRPFYIPGLILYPFHFSMRWMAEAEMPEALAAGGGFAIQGTGVDNVFAFSIDERNPRSNYITLDIHELTVSKIFGILIPDSQDLKLLFSFIDFGFKSLVLNINPAQKKFHLYADLYFYFLHGKVIADIDPTSGIFFSGKLDPVNLGNGLVKLVSYDNDLMGPFIHLNTNIRALIAGKVPPNPATPEWAGISTSDPKLDNSIFALTAKIVFIGREFGVFGLIDQTGLMLFTYMGLNVNLPGLKIKAKTQLNVVINKKMFLASIGFNFGLKIDLPSFFTLGIKHGKIHVNIDLDISMTLQINYGAGGSIVYRIDFHLKALGLSVDLHVDVDISIKDLKDIPHFLEGVCRERLIDHLEGKVKKDTKKAGEAVEKVGKDLTNTLSKGFNVAEHDVAAVYSRCGQDVKQIASSLREDLGMGLDGAVHVFSNLGHDISGFADDLAREFNISKLAVAEETVLQGFCSAEHALVSGLHKGAQEFDKLGHSTIEFADHLADVGLVGVKDIAKRAAQLGDDISKKADELAQDIQNVGKDFKGTADELAKVVEEKSKEFADFAKKAAGDLGMEIHGTIDHAADAIKDGAKAIVAEVGKAREVEQAAQEAAKAAAAKAEQAAKEAAAKVEEATREAKAKAEALAKEAQQKAEEAARAVEARAKQAAKEAEERAKQAAEAAKQEAERIAAKAKQEAEAAAAKAKAEAERLAKEAEEKAKKAADAVANAAKKAASGVSDAGKKVGKTAEKAGKAVGSGISKGFHKIFG